MSNIGKRIKSQRELKGWTQEELATRMGYKSKSTINKIELGINDITQSKVVRFAEVLDTTIEYLMGRDKEQIDAISTAHSESMEDLSIFDEEIRERNLIRENQKKIRQEIGDVVFSDDEINQIIDYVKFIISKRKE